MSVIMNEGVMEEVDALKAILMEDVTVNMIDQGAFVVTTVNPMTGGDVSALYVCVTLEVIIDGDYPKSSPIVNLRNPRGLDDIKLKVVTATIDQTLSEYSGTPVLYAVIQNVRGLLTKLNLPSGECSICFYQFWTGDRFIRTVCYHHYHCICVKRLIYHSKLNYAEMLEELPQWKRNMEPAYENTCVVCRAGIGEIEVMEDPPEPVESLMEPPITISPEIRKMQAEMKVLREYQRAKGGLIEEGDNGPPPLIITDAPTIHDGPSTSRAALASDAAAAAAATATAATAAAATATAAPSRANDTNNNNKKWGNKQSPKKNGNNSNGNGNGNGNHGQNNNGGGRKQGGEQAQGAGQTEEPAKVYRGFNRNNRGRGRKGNGGSR